MSRRASLSTAVALWLFQATVTLAACNPEHKTPVAATAAPTPRPAPAPPAPSSEATEKAGSHGSPHTSALQAEDSAEPVSRWLGADWEERAFDRADENAPPWAVGVPVEVNMERDRSLRVTHAEPGRRGAIVYLPGMCGNPKGADSWSDLAARRGTLIVLRANIKCPDRPGYKWPQDPHLIQARIQEALAKVRTERKGDLDTSQVVLMGYSQGAHRAELLAGAFPSHYPFIILGGPPTTAEPENFGAAQAVAILGGELENTQHMEQGVWKLDERGIRVRFFVLPGAHHGDYGPSGRRVMSDVLQWLFDEAVTPRSNRKAWRNQEQFVPTRRALRPPSRPE